MQKTKNINARLNEAQYKLIQDVIDLGNAKTPSQALQYLLDKMRMGLK